MRKTVAILGVPIDDLNSQEALVRLDEFVRQRRFHQVATANVDFLIKATKDPELMSILRMCDLVVPDGMPLVTASRWLGAPLRERVTGADMVPSIAALAAEKGYRIFMLGGRPEVAQAARKRMLDDHPDLQIVGCVSPPVGHIVEMPNEALLEQIRAAAPDILLVAFGNPKQEKWVHMHRDRLDVPVCIGIGATFDFIAGEVRRAPNWMQRSGLEWVFRLAQEPKRLFKRYAIDIVEFSRLIGIQIACMGRSGTGAAAIITRADTEAGGVLSIDGSLDARVLIQFQLAADAVLTAGKRLVIDLNGATRVDSAVMGTLINLDKRAKHVGADLVIVGANSRVARALRAAGCPGLDQPNTTVAAALGGTEARSGRVEIQAEALCTTVQVIGVADHATASDLTATLRLTDFGKQSVTFDLSDTTYVDCSFLAVLLAEMRNAAAQSQSVHYRLGSIVSSAVRREGLEDALRRSVAYSADAPACVAT